MNLKLRSSQYYHIQLFNSPEQIKKVEHHLSLLLGPFYEEGNIDTVHADEHSKLYNNTRILPFIIYPEECGIY
jgi:hypothetical protein